MSNLPLCRLAAVPPRNCRKLEMCQARPLSPGLGLLGASERPGKRCVKGFKLCVVWGRGGDESERDEEDTCCGEHSLRVDEHDDTRVSVTGCEATEWETETSET
eukprot:1430677-Rhodomonas_salina.2